MREGHEKTAAEALDYVEEATGRFVVHFEMDVTDFVDLPVADVPRINAGLTFGEALACLGTFASSPKSAGLVDAVAGKKCRSSGSAPHVPRRSRRTDR